MVGMKTRCRGLNYFSFFSNFFRFLPCVRHLLCVLTQYRFLVKFQCPLTPICNLFLFIISCVLNFRRKVTLGGVPNSGVGLKNFQCIIQNSSIILSPMQAARVPQWASRGRFQETSRSRCPCMRLALRPSRICANHG